MTDVESAYNNSHRAFLQAFLARSVMTFEEAQPILAAILSARDGKPHHNPTFLSRRSAQDKHPSSKQLSHFI